MEEIKIGNQEKFKRDVREHLLMLKNEFKDEIPSEIIHSDAPDNKYKVRRAWFQGVVADIANVIDEGIIADAEVKMELEKFIDYATSEEFHEKELTGEEDIQWANRVIDSALGKLLD